jgi:hypothetical protein
MRLRSVRWIWVFCAWLSVSGSVSSASELTGRVFDPGMGLSHWSFSAELLGQAGLYGFHGSFRPMEPLAFNLGVSFLSNTDGRNLVLPASVSWLVGQNGHYLELLGGVTLGSSAIVVGPLSGGALYGVLGVGYRFWPDLPGFHFRVTGYTLASGQKAIFLPGATFGAAL